MLSICVHLYTTHRFLVFHARFIWQLISKQQLSRFRFSQNNKINCSISFCRPSFCEHFRVFSVFRGSNLVAALPRCAICGSKTVPRFKTPPALPRFLRDQYPHPSAPVPQLPPASKHPPAGSPVCRLAHGRRAACGTYRRHLGGSVGAANKQKML